MTKINAIIVDDEINARENLRYLLNDFCSNVKILAEASNVKDAVLLIKKNKPDIVFLDIQMPQKNGFQLLEEFSEINFQIIFVTAYDNYAIKAFQVAAIDYLLKPIDVDLLKEAILKVENNIKNKISVNRYKLLKENNKKLAIPHKNDYVIVQIDNILCIEADRMYSKIYLLDDKTFLVSKKLSYYENLFLDDEKFIRAHRSWIININTIKTYSKKDKEVILKNGYKVPISKGHKDDFEKIFTNHL
ncbi:LytTR family DNA-binding domain-containing protein [Polaribacter vadi]|uniref:LytR/AlgR family response regulator transcription factor n=1 Tax=Polaribacter TaxID=52959 RepID=UPI001C08A736|nr:MULTISPECIES: LytTR family DNA-binding domain-containing protein [Polaribacter]MBU3012790.1 LytTR family DNA-binding domain-containing protein [Polaribacter vadi]MDO6742606.1 LytTR family DNA-binding domain-containing protein [Polaribacter sp. 1_MG-2023]